MSTQNVHRFRQAVQASPALQSEIRSLADRGAFDPVGFGAARGFAFTRADLATALEQLSGQLTDLELDLMGRQRRAAAGAGDLEPRKPVVGGASSPTAPTAGSKSVAQAY